MAGARRGAISLQASQRCSEVREGNGSRVVFELEEGGRLYLHRPHPGKEAKKYQVEEVRAWLRDRGIMP